MCHCKINISGGCPDNLTLRATMVMQFTTDYKAYYMSIKYNIKLQTKLSEKLINESSSTWSKIPPHCNVYKSSTIKNKNTNKQQQYNSQYLAKKTL